MTDEVTETLELAEFLKEVHGIDINDTEVQEAIVLLNNALKKFDGKTVRNNEES